MSSDSTVEKTERIDISQIQVRGANVPEALKEVALLPSNMFYGSGESGYLPLQSKSLVARLDSVKDSFILQIGSLEGNEVDDIRLPEGLLM